MTTGVTFFDWSGVPALTQDGAARAVLAKGGKWLGANPDDGITAAAVATTGVNVGRDEFDSRFASWGLADLDDWYQRRDPARPFDSYRKARAWAHS